MVYKKRSRDEHFKEAGPKRILALDGGGLRGIVTLAYLGRIEDLLRARFGGTADFRLGHYFDLIAGGALLQEAVVRGSQERMVPVLMTALAAALGLVPLVFAAGEPGSEILAPLSVVVLGGLLSSTFLNLLVVPAGFFLMFKNKVPVLEVASGTRNVPP